MFTIIGGDGKEYGPVTVEQIREWITAGRTNLDTQAKALGTEEWRRVGDFAEFASPDGAPPVLPTTGSSTPVAALVPADRGLRLAAFLVDRVIAFACAVPGAVILGVAFLKVVLAAAQGHTDQLNLENFDLGRVALGALMLGAGMLAILIVQVWMLSTRGQTIGKRMFGLRVVLHRDGGKAGFLHAWLLRNFVPGLIQVIPWVGVLFLVVDVLFIFSEDRRCLHDLIAGTRVVKA